jgi:hypothetical protein
MDAIRAKKNAFIIAVGIPFVFYLIVALFCGWKIHMNDRRNRK